jgi:hypothetical protein
VRFEVDRVVGPFELCHCNRCRKVSGSAFSAMVGVNADDFRLLSGVDLIREFEAPILRAPPAYRVPFCSRCGSPVPSPRPGEAWFEIPAGLLEGDPQYRPDRHILIEWAAPWHEITDDLPQLDGPALVRLRRGNRPAKPEPD